MSGKDFWTSGMGNGKFHSHFSGTGIQVENSNPIFGNGNGNENSIPIFGNTNESEKFNSRLLGRELVDGIPGNSREREPEWHHKIGSELSRKFRGMLL